MPEIKRLHYFNHQFLNEQDFRDEQAYHTGMRHRHNRLLHTSGIAEGLTVERASERQVTINPGTAYDAVGRELVLDSAVTEDIHEHGANTQVFVGLRYGEKFREDDRQSGGGVEDFTRASEVPDVVFRKGHGGNDPNTIALARVLIDNKGEISEIDTNVRRYASTKIGPGGISTDELADNAVTSSKLANDVRAKLGGGTGKGWVRMAFVPSPFERVRIDTQRDRVVDTTADTRSLFIQEPCCARCGSGGARGMMTIPIPGGVRRVIHFRIAGHTLGSVDIALYRAGWNRQTNDGQEHRFHEQHLNPGHFDHVSHVDQRFDDDDALTVTVTARGDTRVYLVAAEFE